MRHKIKNKNQSRETNVTFFEKAYSSAVKEGMQILGEDVSKIVQDYIEEKYSFVIENTSQDPKALSEALHFAIDGGKRIIERRIIRLSKKLDIGYHSAELINFEKQVKDMREKVLKTQNR
jgi:arsenate reductase-like glutaredoxin family protein